MHDRHHTQLGYGRLALAACVVAAMLMLAAGAALAGSKPQFSDYPSLEDTFTGAPAKLDNSGRDWAARRTEEILAVNDAMAAGPNFARVYNVVELGCGTGCQIVAAVDLRTGVAIFVGEPASYGASVRVDSRLLVFQKDPVVGTDPVYFVLDDGAFRRLD